MFSIRPPFNLKVVLLFSYVHLQLFPPPPLFVLSAFEGRCHLTTAMTRSAPNSFHWEEIARQGQIPNDLYCENRFNRSACTIWPPPGLSHGVAKGKVPPRVTCIWVSVTTLNEGAKGLSEKCVNYDFYVIFFHFHKMQWLCKWTAMFNVPYEWNVVHK